MDKKMYVLLTSFSVSFFAFWYILIRIFASFLSVGNMPSYLVILPWLALSLFTLVFGGTYLAKETNMAYGELSSGEKEKVHRYGIKILKKILKDVGKRKDSWGKVISIFT